MKMVKYLFCCLLFPCFTANAQQKDSSTIYYDKEWRILVDNSDDVFYIRKAIKKDSLWYANDYFADGNKLQMSGSYKYGLDSVKEGHFIWYHKNGNKSQESSYKDGKEEGNWLEWHENGKIEVEGKNVDGKKEGVWKEWHENGSASSIANYSEGYIVGKYESWWDNGNKYCVSQYLEDINKIKSYEKKDSTGKTITRLGIFVGTCKYYFKNGVMSSKEEWRNDSLVAMEVWDENGVSESPTRDKEGRLTSELVAEFDGGMKELQNFLVKNIRYPKKSRSRNEQGRVVLKFIVEKDGQIKNVEIQQTSGFPLLDEEGMRVIYSMSGDWKPGKQHNQPVRVYYTLPITYKLDK